MPADKLHPRNRTARIATARAAGNPVVTELESGVGNCYPGLEFDARNIDRRFFPYLVVDFGVPRRAPTGTVTEMVVATVDLDRATADESDLVEQLDRLISWPTPWRVTRLRGQFAGYDGERDFEIAALASGASGAPPDDWTAVRLLRPGTAVTITVEADHDQSLTLTATRASYLRDDGAFAAMFEPGELTQSLCSPWTHDFRDCGCFYWASNHPDIVAPAIPTPGAPDNPAYTPSVVWLRRDRVTSPPPADPGHGGELRHHEINDRWPELDVVLDGRERRAPYAPTTVTCAALPVRELVPTLRYAAGVELAVMLEYLAALYSLNHAATGDLGGDIAVARYELLRVAQSEMRHLKAVNGLLLGEHQAAGALGPFQPALGVATVVPAGADTVPSLRFRPLTVAVLDEFIRVEAPSTSVDALYGRVLATYQAAGRDTEAATVSQVMAEGADHYSTFRVIRELLGQHPESDYLLPVRVPAPGDDALTVLQHRFERMLDFFYTGYTLGVPPGGAAIAAGRMVMLGDDGVEGACTDLAAQNILPVFAVPADPRFTPVDPPS